MLCASREPPSSGKTKAWEPNRTEVALILVASNAWGRPYSPAFVVNAASGTTPFFHRFTEFGVPPGWILIWIGTTHSTVTVVGAGLFPDTGSLPAGWLGAIFAP